jgi:hypothetical protein
MIVRTALFTCFVLAASSAAQAQDAATLNHCWGDIASDVGQLGLMGQHSRRDSTMRPEQQPRRGVGNVSKEDFGDGTLSEGAQGTHAIVVGEQLEEAIGVEIECE